MKVADYAVASGDAVISTIGLGSCVAIVLHDPVARVGGLAHVLLPSEAMSRDTGNRAKFPGTAVPLLVCERLAVRVALNALRRRGRLLRTVVVMGTNIEALAICSMLG